MKLQERLIDVNRKRLLVGIDIGKDKHWAAIGDTKGNEIMKPFKFDNNLEGFNLLTKRIGSLNN